MRSYPTHNPLFVKTARKARLRPASSLSRCNQFRLPMALLAQRMAIGERQVLFARLPVYRKQIIHESHDALQSGVGRLGLALHFNGIHEASPGMRHAAGVGQIFGADVFFIDDVPIGVEDSAIVLEELLGDLLASRHLEIEARKQATKL